ncbi:MAG: SAM-dependent methyltransferase [Limisphaerales bacterium]|jgi:SAM-dependent methyltransferase
MSKLIDSSEAWYTSWFDTPWYHILYQNRNDQEAYAFIDRLLAFLKPAKNAEMLDHACGKGRHARRLAEYGFNVTGADLSAENIKEASLNPMEKLQFFRADMREPLYRNQFDFIFNFFTSFGYFEEEADNLKVMKAVYTALKPGGQFVIDFMNSEKTINNLVKQEEKTLSDIQFSISKHFTGTHIVKEIDFESDGLKRHFEEKVRAVTLDDFKALFEQADLQINHVFGDYKLSEFDPSSSDRLIIITRKAD